MIYREVRGQQMVKTIGDQGPGRATTRRGPRGSSPVIGRWCAVGLVLAGTLGCAGAATCAVALHQGLLSSFQTVGVLATGVVVLRAATRSAFAPLLFGGTFLLTIWLLTPSERIVFASDRDTPGRLQIYALDIGDTAERLSATSGQDDAPAASPDGRHIAFTRRLDGRERIFISGKSGESAVAAPLGAGNDRHPVWSPDGRWLAFASDRGGDWDVYAMAADGSQLWNISHHPARDEWPTWSPDGRQLAFESDRGGDPDVWIAAADGTGARPLGGARATRRQPAWSPDGRRLAFVAGDDAGRLCVAGLGGEARWCLGGPGSYAAPAWSPSGDRLAYSVRGIAGWDIFVVPGTGGAGSNVSRQPGLNLTPCWTGNGPIPAVGRWWSRLIG